MRDLDLPRLASAFTRVPEGFLERSGRSRRRAACGGRGTAALAEHTEAVDELDVEGILAFAERILPRVADLWVQASRDYGQGLQQLFYREGIVYDGNRFNRTAATAPLFRYSEPDERAESSLASPTGFAEKYQDYFRTTHTVRIPAA